MLARNECHINNDLDFILKKLGFSQSQCSQGKTSNRNILQISNNAKLLLFHPKYLDSGKTS